MEICHHVLFFSLTLMYTGVIYQDASDNYRIHSNTAGYDLLTGQVITRSEKVLAYVRNSAVDRIEEHETVSLSRFAGNTRAAALTPGTLAFGALAECGAADFPSPGVWLNDDLLPALDEGLLVTEDGAEFLRLGRPENDGILLPVHGKVLFENDTFMTDRILFVTDEASLRAISEATGNPVETLLLFNLKEKTANAVQTYFSRMNAEFENTAERFSSVVNNRAAGYEGKLFQMGQDRVVLLMSLLSYVFAVLAMLSGVVLKERYHRTDMANLRRIGVSAGRLCAALTLDIFLLYLVADLAAFWASYGLMFLALNRINFVFVSNLMGLNIGLSWRLFVKFVLFSALNFAVVMIPIWHRLAKVSPVDYDREEEYRLFVRSSSGIYGKSPSFRRSFAALLLTRDRRYNLLEIFLVGIPLCNIAFLLLVDLRGIPQESAELELYYAAMWDFSIVMAVLRSAACAFALLVLNIAHRLTEKTDEKALTNLGVERAELNAASAIRYAALLLISSVLSFCVSSLYMTYTRIAAEKYGLTVGYHLPLLETILYIVAVFAVKKLSDTIADRFGN